MWNLLIADDEPKIRNGLADTILRLRSDIHVVGLAKNGQEALDLLRMYRPELLLLDICMPKLSGLDLLAKIQELNQGQTVKTLIISGFSEFSYAQQAIRYGVSAYLLKPIDEQELMGHLERMIGELEREKQGETDEADRQLARQSLINLILGGKSGQPLPEAIENGIRHLAEQFADPEINSLKWQQLTCSNADYLSRKLKQETGYTFQEMLTAFRLLQSCRYLQHARTNISDIAYQVGYASPDNYSRAFRQAIGCSPRHFQSLPLAEQCMLIDTYLKNSSAQD